MQLGSGLRCRNLVLPGVGLAKIPRQGENTFETYSPRPLCKQRTTRGSTIFYVASADHGPVLFLH